jgi:serine/threonine protein kinase
MGDESQTSVVRERVLGKGYLDAQQLDEALARYQQTGRKIHFASFLLEEGLLTLEQLGEVRPASLSSTSVEDTFTGRRFSGYLVGEKLGQGGMGRVYKAYREPDGLEVVIKFLAPELAAKRSWRARFVRMSRLLETISHPALLTVYGVEGLGEHPHVIMELVTSESLDRTLMRRGALPGPELTRIARDIALGLEEAHRRGLVHRDIKPSNVAAGEGGVKLLDFDLAKNVRAAELGLTRAGQVMGTPHYMAPEQWGEHAVDARADLFSLGATLYHLATGMLPFNGDMRQIGRKILEGDFIPPRELRPELAEEFELVLLRLLEPDREFRYQTARQVAEDLQQILEGAPVDVPRLVETSGERAGRRHPLVRGKRFTLGREEGCDVLLPDGSVSRRHAQIRRHDGGYLFVDRGSTTGSYVNGMSIRDVRLKPGDRVQLGAVELVFHDGGLSAAQRDRPQSEDEQPEVRTVPAPLLGALQSLGDRRTTLSLLEQLAPGVQEERLGAAVRVTRGLFGAEAAELVRAHMEPKLKRQRSLLPGRLYAMTHENLGDSVHSWLRWWDEVQGDYPDQLAQEKRQRRTRLLVRPGEPEGTVFFLEGKDRFRIGREEGVDLVLRDRSVSRLHATIMRLHQQLVIRDEESRFGVVVNGVRQAVAFLGHGDQLQLGKVEMVFQREPLPSAPTRDSQGVYTIDAEAFRALLHAKHPAAAAGAIAFLESEDRVEWLLEEAGRLFPKRPDAVHFANRVHRRYLKRAEPAYALLEAVLGTGPEHPEEWRRRLAERREDLPAQVLPLGWFPSSWESLDTQSWRLG